ncbi:MAG: S1 RNA-binding domain-containing protein, partial [Gallionella sp.]|nr:S1 RNA-binding domain-containing protein [Gallionella sp.]
ISALSNTFVKDPHSIVKAGQIVKVKVLEIDEKRKRIALTMRLTDSAVQTNNPPRDAQGPRNQHAQTKAPTAVRTSRPVTPNAMAAAFSKLKH